MSPQLLSFQCRCHAKWQGLSSQTWTAYDINKLCSISEVTEGVLGGFHITLWRWQHFETSAINILCHQTLETYHIGLYLSIYHFFSHHSKIWGCLSNVRRNGKRSHNGDVSDVLNWLFCNSGIIFVTHGAPSNYVNEGMNEKTNSPKCPLMIVSVYSICLTLYFIWD